MSWNGSTQVSAGKSPANKSPVGGGAIRQPKSKALAHGLIAGLIIVALGGAAVWWFMDNRVERAGEPKRINRTRYSKITETIPVTSKVITPTDEHSTHATRIIVATNDHSRTKLIQPPEVKVNELYNIMSNGKLLFEKPIFTNSAENIIGALLSEQPGTRFLDVELGDDFDQDFKESLKVEITIEADDTEDVIKIKEAVSAAKGKMAAAMEGGLRPSEMVSDLRAATNKIADYRDQLQEAFDEVKETGSAQEIEAFLKETNKILDEYGAKHIDLPEDEVEWINERLSKEQNKKGE